MPHEANEHRRKKEAIMQHNQRQRYTVPTHLKTPDKVVLGLTARQLLILLIGACMSYNLWFQLAILGEKGPLGQALHLLLVGSPFIVTLFVALLTVANRQL